MRVVHRAGFAGTSFGYCLCPLHHQRSAHLADVTGWARFDCILAVWVIGTREEYAKAAAFFYHFSSFAVRRIICARGALHARFTLRLFHRILLYEFTFRIIGARDEAAEAAFALDLLAIFTLRAGLADFLGRRDLAAVFAARSETIGKLFA